jgi:hypothetical protein
VTFGQIVEGFFQRRTNAVFRFSHKLFNALTIGKGYPCLVPFLGIAWITSHVIRVEKSVFARLLNIKVVDGSLFHRQGNFPSHGFVELCQREAKEMCPADALQGVDFDNVRLLKHASGAFTRESSARDVRSCKWINRRRAGQLQ